MIRIALVDDHELVRTGFRLILSKEADMEIIAEMPVKSLITRPATGCPSHCPGARSSTSRRPYPPFRRQVIRMACARPELIAPTPFAMHSPPTAAPPPQDASVPDPPSG